MIMVSACLCGINCRYDGRNNLIPKIAELFKQGEAIAVCPEQLGGLPIPHSPSEIENGTGADVLDGLKRVINREGLDVTEAFIKGAELTLAKAREYNIDYAVLKSRSPSCGAGSVYDGSFSKTLRNGDGVAAALLKRNGFRVISDEEF